MSTVYKGLIFAAIALVVDLVFGLVVLRPLFGLSWGTAGGLTAALVIFGVGWGFLTGRKDIYSFEPRTIWVFILDVSWSAINTFSGVIWTIWCAVKGTFVTPEEKTRKRGIVRFAGAALGGGGATTLGTVIGGDWMLHEAVHVQQARIFGPLYWPVYITSYLTSLLVRFLTARFSDAHWEAYARVVMEDWAYRAAPEPDPGKDEEIKLLQSFIWFTVALVHAAALVVLIVPLAHALGLTLIPWWTGLMVILVYALGRSFLPKANAPTAQLVFT